MGLTTDERGWGFWPIHVCILFVALTDQGIVLKLAQMAEGVLRPAIWIGSSLDDLRRLSEAVQDEIGYAIYFAQQGGRHSSAKVLKGFGGAGVLENR